MLACRSLLALAGPSAVFSRAILPIARVGIPKPSDVNRSQPRSDDVDNHAALGAAHDQQEDAGAIEGVAIGSIGISRYSMRLVILHDVDFIAGAGQRGLSLRAAHFDFVGRAIQIVDGQAMKNRIRTAGGNRERCQQGSAVQFREVVICDREFASPTA